MAVGRASLALSRFAAPRPGCCFVLFLGKTGDQRVFHENIIINDLRNKLKHSECPTLRSDALLSTLSEIMSGVFISRDFGSY